SATWSSDLVELGPVPCTTGGFRTSTPSVAFDTQDTATVAFDCFDGFGGRLFTRPLGSAKFTPFTGPPGSGSPTIVTDPNGYLIATWSAAGITYTSVYDAVAPTIDTVTPPSGAVAGQPVAFDVAGSDVWGPVTYSVDFGDGSSPATGRAIAPRRGALARATVTNSVAHTYANPGDYTATVTVADNAANTATTSRAVSVAPAPGAAPSVTPPVLPPVTAPGLPDPIAGQTVNIAPVKVPVRVKLPGAKRFIPLTAPAQVRVGSIIDTTKGRVRITIDNGHLGFDTADFYEGLFKVLQTKAVKAFATMQLTGGSFKGCPRAPKVKIARKQLSAKRSVRHLWGAGNGAFRTVGRFSSASIRGTKWLTDDRCNGTLTRVTQGKVAVRDFVRRKTIVLKKGQRYLAKPRAKR
ncbi:MAG: hypothetical protein QOE63_1638, partial [Acidimicrobiaceae bacterium]